MYKPELLLPAGNFESFFAAISGGADAVYLGLKKFNARNRAKNFSYRDLYDIVSEAHKKNKKVYVTLNTLIKNEELTELVELIGVLSQMNVDAVIVQDFAVLSLIKKYFRNLKVHASTQMAVHNSAGCNFFKKQGLERVILSRELSANELKMISKRSEIEKEVFVHGALCYSFSGYCLFSSYSGGFSANRGLCKQVCRRNFISEKNEGSIFSLKDFQLIDFIPLFSELKIASLKIEGRMKAPDYIYNTARAYRMAIDDHKKIPEAKEILKYDFGREKTLWFMGGNVKNSITSNTGTGILIGKINLLQDEEGFTIKSDIVLDEYSKLRYRNLNDTEAEFIKIKKISKSSGIYTIICNTDNLSDNSKIYLAGTNQMNYKAGFSNSLTKKINLIGQKQKESIKNSFKLLPIKQSKNKIYLRISDLDRLREVALYDFEAIFLKLRFADMEKLAKINLPDTVKDKIRIELPKYISELRLINLQKTIKKLADLKYSNFVISHLSQIELLPKNVNITCNENVYLLNDIAISYIQSFGIKEYCYPLENDYPNLLRGRDRNGIIPVYYFPELFYSRMPVKSGDILKDEAGKKYRKIKFNGFTIIIDSIPVSITQNINKLNSKGFYKFIIDLSYESDLKKIKNILNSVKKSEKTPNSIDFNMKKGLH